MFPRNYPSVAKSQQAVEQRKFKEDRKQKYLAKLEERRVEIEAKRKKHAGEIRYVFTGKNMYEFIQDAPEEEIFDAWHIILGIIITIVHIFLAEPKERSSNLQPTPDVRAEGGEVGKGGLTTIPRATLINPKDLGLKWHS